MNQAIQNLGTAVACLTWDEVYRRIDRKLQGRNFHKVYGIPRGGAIVAGITGRAVPDASLADVIVDDIIDTGETMRRVRAANPKKPFVALVDKRREYQGCWVHFPWETSVTASGEDSVRRLIEWLGEDPAREGLRDTPSRVSRAWRELTEGYRMDPAKILSRDFPGCGYDEVVISRNIDFVSSCEHHMMPFTGVAHVGYLPGKRVVGLSKLARLVDCFARRLQIQEQMTVQIAQALQQALKPRGVAVVLEARHSCMSCRGVRKSGSDMVTSSMLGSFRRPEARAEFMSLALRGGTK